MTHDNRLEAVDFIKGCAITGIVIFHCYEAIYGWPGHDLFNFLSGGLLSSYTLNFNSLDATVKSLLKFTGLGYQGVSVFIVMSGFLQMWTSQREKLVPSKYYLKRFTRLYPLYWLAIFGVLGLNLFLKRNPGINAYQLYGAFFGWAPLLAFNPSFWFISLIVQFYLVFPFLQNFLIHTNEKKFLFVALLVTVLSLAIRSFLGVFGRFFVGCWLIEFGIGMILANHYAEADSKLRGFKTIILLSTSYFLGLAFTGFPIVVLVSRAVYGISLTLLLWSIYNTIRENTIFSMMKKAFIITGINSYAIFLINQPFIQEYYVFMMLLLNPYRNLHFISEITGDVNNFLVIRIDTYLMMMFIYIVIIFYLSSILIKFEAKIIHKVSVFIKTHYNRNQV